MSIAARHTFILGGAKSGKTRLALALAERLAEQTAQQPVYLATATAGDEEMRLRIARHQCERGPHWRTVEEPVDLAGALERAAGGVVLVDCLTLWVSNLLTMAGLDDEAVAERGRRLALALPELPGEVILVANEVGLGIVPDNPLARRYRDLAGGLNQRVAAACGRVALVAAGLPLALKGEAVTP